MSESAIYAKPRSITRLEDCWFYHSMDIPHYGAVQGPWDLRGNIDAYLGGVGFRGKRVLELGTASGFICFHLEKQGAEVIAFDLADEAEWDIVPLASHHNLRETVESKRGQVQTLKNGYWLAHGAHGSKARVVYGDIYAIPEAIGPVDIATFGCILLHLRDPFLALTRTSSLVRETIVITEPAYHPVLSPLRAGSYLSAQRWRAYVKRLAIKLCGLSRWERTMASLPVMVFLPDRERGGPIDTWWHFQPELLRQFLCALGFTKTRCQHHTQTYLGKPYPMVTIVGQREDVASQRCAPRIGEAA